MHVFESSSTAVEYEKPSETPMSICSDDGPLSLLWGVSNWNCRVVISESSPSSGRCSSRLELIIMSA